MYPSQFKIDNISIDGIDVMGLFINMEIYENIFIPLVTGNIEIMDTDAAGFVEQNQIEFNEDFEFTVESVDGTTMNFVGVLNGVEKEGSDKNRKIYKINFVSQEMRVNDQTFVSEKILGTPQDIVSDMIERIEGQIEPTGDAGKEMEFIAGRWKPLHVVKHCLTHGVGSEASATNNGQEQEEDARGSSGFLCWQIIGEGQNEYRMCSVDDLLEGTFDTHEPYEMKISMRGSSGEEDLSSIIEYNFQDMGDIQTKMKSGAFRATVVSFDMDSGLYKEYEYDGSREQNIMTQKQQDIVQAPTRVLMRPYTNDKFEQTCEPAQDNTGDQSREYLQQCNARQNTFNDQTGSVTLYPQFNVHAGDIIELQINKVRSGDSQGDMENRKHSGRYVVKQIGHHFGTDGRCFSKITTIRSTAQQDRRTANQ